MHVINHPDICTCRCRNIIYDKFPGQSVNSCLRNFDWDLYLVWAFDSDAILCGSEQKIRKITQEDQVIFFTFESTVQGFFVHCTNFSVVDKITFQPCINHTQSHGNPVINLTSNATELHNFFLAKKYDLLRKISMKQNFLGLQIFSLTLTTLDCDQPNFQSCKGTILWNFQVKTNASQ